MKAGIIIFPGSNCDRDTCVALNKAGIKVSKFWHREKNLPNDLNLIVIAGGFSYGDYLRSGAISSVSSIMNEVKRLSKRGINILGICNGFQILTESGLLKGALLQNTSSKFICKEVELIVENNESKFTSSYKTKQKVRIPIAHMDGRYFANKDQLKYLNDHNMIAFRYVDKNNYNGSLEDIAGIFNKERNILGMMPHPERAIDKTINNSDHGLEIFKSFSI